MKKEHITHAIFGFKDKETGEKLRQFFKKHTGKDCDFNGIQHYKNGFKLLLFSIPLNTIQQVGITAAGCAPSYIKRFTGLDDFVTWYERDYLKKATITEIEEASMFKSINPEFCDNFRELNINIDIAFDPFPTAVKFQPLRMPRRGEAQATIVLGNGLCCRVPMDELHHHWLLMNMDICTKNSKTNWELLLQYLKMEPLENEIENMSRLTPDDNHIRYPKKYDEDILYLCNCINYVLNKEEPFDYPKNWFEVAKMLKQKRGGPVGCDGDVLVGYMFASPRSYLRYFQADKNVKDIALDIFYDAC